MSMNYKELKSEIVKGIRSNMAYDGYIHTSLVCGMFGTCYYTITMAKYVARNNIRISCVGGDDKIGQAELLEDALRGFVTDEIIDGIIDDYEKDK